ncbi:MAG TPA: SIR2 family protein, partial [Anaerolineales bacterium]|nr:SIR2 family protein [Anaerolineales bacterium]
RARDPLEPYKVIAELPLPIYITTNFNALLSSALKEAGKDPQVVLCPWNEYVEQAESIYDREPEYFPSPERPLVYHLFGQFDEPDSVVLTEDDYFDFLIGVTSNNKLVPPAVRRALTDTALLFLGFQMDDWNFRVLFRSIISRQGGGRRDRYAHIAAQIEPEEGRILEPERARRYLENYFSKGADISIYWGSTVDFMKELQQHLKRNHP